MDRKEFDLLKGLTLTYVYEAEYQGRKSLGFYSPADLFLSSNSHLGHPDRVHMTLTQLHYDFEFPGVLFMDSDQGSNEEFSNFIRKVFEEDSHGNGPKERKEGLPQQKPGDFG